MGERKRQLREEVAELAEAVRQLREQLAGHHCHGCSCVHWYYPYYPQTYGAAGNAYPYIVTYQAGGNYAVGSGGSGGA